MKLFDRVFRRNQDAYVFQGQEDSGNSGIFNAGSGAGVKGRDWGTGFSFAPTRFYSRYLLDVIYVQSWAARKTIDIPVQDAVVRWRQWNTEPEIADVLKEQERMFGVRDRFANAMKASRLYGTAFVLLVTREAPLEEPLFLDALREGDLAALHVVDRYDLSVTEVDNDIASPTYGQPLSYRFQSGYAESPVANIHASRLLRFDGIAPMCGRGFERYDRHWGISVLVPVLDLVLQEHSAASGAAHLVQDASIPVIKKKGFNEQLTGRADPDVPTIEQQGEAFKRGKSIYNTLFLDWEDDFLRVSASFGSIPDVMDRFARRIAAAADIPATRFWGASPLGMNATGESDLRNYAEAVAGKQVEVFEKPLRILDQVLLRNAGLDLPDPPDYEWLSLLDQSESDKAEVGKKKTEALKIALDAGVIDEDEARTALDGDVLFGELQGAAPGLPSVPEGEMVPAGDVPTTDFPPEE